MRFRRIIFSVVAGVAVAVAVGCGSTMDPQPRPIQVPEPGAGDDQRPRDGEDYRNCDPIPVPIDNGLPKLFASYPRELSDGDIDTVEVLLLSQTRIQTKVKNQKAMNSHYRGAYKLVVTYKKRDKSTLWEVDKVLLYRVGDNEKFNPDYTTTKLDMSTEGDIDVHFKTGALGTGRYVRALRIEARDTITTIPLYSVYGE